MPRNVTLLVNAISLGRIGLAVGIMFAAAANRWDIVLACALIAFSTDWIDGMLARHWSAISAFGAFIDPFADKVVCLSVLWPVAIWHDQWPYWAIAILITAYDIFTVSMRLRVQHSSNFMIAASPIAKLKTALLMVGLLVSTVAVAITHAQGDNLTGIHAVGLVLLAAASLLAIASLKQYGAKLTQTKAKSTPSEVSLQRGIAHIDFAVWHQQGITCMLMDIEGTIAHWRTHHIPPEVRMALERAKAAGIQHIALISNIAPMYEQRVKAICHELELEHYWIPRSTAERKPSATMIRYALQHFHTTPAHTAFVGDKLVDVLAGKRAGVAKIVWVQRLGTADHPADRFIYRPIEPVLRYIVRRLNP